MKKTIITFVLSFLIVFSFFPNIVFAEQEGDFTYSISGLEVTIIGYTGSGGAGHLWRI